MGPSGSLLPESGCSLLQPHISRLVSHRRLCRSPQQKREPAAPCRAPWQRRWQQELAGRLASSGQSNPRHFGIHSRTQPRVPAGPQAVGKGEQSTESSFTPSLGLGALCPSCQPSHLWWQPILFAGISAVQLWVHGSTCNPRLQTGDHPTPECHDPAAGQRAVLAGSCLTNPLARQR